MIQKLLNAWSKRHLTPLGKIAVIKLLVVSKITYLTMNIPDPTEGFIQELEKMLFDFLWNGKKDKIKRKMLCQAFEQGGLKMVNIHEYL